MRASYSGNTAVSKTVNVGSIPTARAKSKKEHSARSVLFCFSIEYVGIEGYFKKANCLAFLKTQALKEEMRHVL